MAFELPSLPYAPDALSPHISEQTIGFHYGKHHQAYVTNLNNLVAGTENDGKSLEEIILAAEAGPVFNNAAQIWNHTFYWHSMAPSGGGDPDGDLQAAIEASFESVDTFKQTFADKAKTLFGSGWTWLVKGNSGLEIVQTKDRAAHHRCVGARLLPGLPERPAGLRRHVGREPPQLGVRCREPGQELTFRCCRPWVWSVSGDGSLVRALRWRSPTAGRAAGACRCDAGRGRRRRVEAGPPRRSTGPPGSRPL